MEIINVIDPKDIDEKLSYRNALGYCWQNLNDRVPGIDRPIIGSATETFNAIETELAEKYGNITVTVRDGISERLVINDKVDWDNSIDIPSENLLAVVNSMWCGGMTRLIYAGKYTGKNHKVNEFVPVEEGLTKMDEPKHGENGYCRKCHSYCYGDCEAN